MTTRCHYCHQPAVCRCDHLRRPPAADLDAPLDLCDRPLCGLHRHRKRRQHGWLYSPLDHGPLSLDYCPEHAQIHGLPLET